MTRRDSLACIVTALALAIAAVIVLVGPARATPRPASEQPPLAAQAQRAAPLHAPSRFHRVYPPETQHARDWLWRGIGDKQFACLDALWHFESGWRVKAGSLTGSYGIAQFYPASKYAKWGADWRTNPMTQVRAGLHYVGAPGFGHGRYGSPCGAWAAWQRQGWY
jgi:hypothetical protein